MHQEDRPRRHVLLMGSSEVTYDDAGAGVGLATLLRSDLAALAPQFDWHVEAHIVYQMSNMPERCLRLAERSSPDLALLWLGGNIFSEETVSYAVFHRSTRLYPYFDRLVNRGRKAAGGGPNGAASLRGLLFRAPRAVAKALIRRRPLIEPEDAFDATVRTIQALRLRWPLLVRLPFRDSFRQPDQEIPSRLRVLQYNSAVREACRSLVVPCIAPSDEVEAEGFGYRMAADGLHANFATRQRVSEVAARHVSALLGSSAAAPPDSTRDVEFSRRGLGG